MLQHFYSTRLKTLNNLNHLKIKIKYFGKFYTVNVPSIGIVIDLCRKFNIDTTKFKTKVMY